jgi:hypothetical protein
MVAGLIQLATSGSLDSFITINPNISYYLFAYKRHTKFALETKLLDFDKTINIDGINNRYRCSIDPNIGDLLSNLYFIYTIPEIYSTDNYRFRWIKNFGTLLIKRAVFYIGSTIVDNISGEYLLLSNELSLLVKDNYDDITGNIEEMYNPSIPIPVIKINNNRFETMRYPYIIPDNIKPSISGREIIIPLSFNFTKNPSLSILLARLQNRKDIYIEIEIEDIENLYQVYSKELDLYISPKYYNELYSNQKSININDFIRTSNKDLKARIEGTFVYLDNYERGLMMISPVKSILLERIFISNFETLISGNNLRTTIELMGANHHTKEIMWILRRSDYNKYNDNFNFTNNIPENINNPIISMANIYFNDKNIMEDKPENFFGKIQPYQYHSTIPKRGIYIYSFGLYPEKWQPSGSYNGANVKTYLYVYVKPANNDVINNKLIKFNKNIYNYDYLIRYFVKSYNVLEYIGGNVGIKYA